jgi:hypothetical protein
MTTDNSLQEAENSQKIWMALEARPYDLVAAIYDQLPFPGLGPIQEVVFDLGVVAHNGTLELKGLVFQGYNGHQLLFEQRWPARILAQRTGEADLRIEAGTGLAVRTLHFMLHAHERMTHIEVTAMAREVGGDKQTVQSVRQLMVRYHEQQTDLHFPLEGTWWAIQGNDWSDFHKSEAYSQPFALDLVKLGPDNAVYRGNGRSLTDHYSWDQPVYATAGGKVAYVCYDMPDMLPGALPDQAILRGDMRRILGNAVAISHANGEFSYFAHLQQASIPVNVGEMIRRGALIGRVGNSGNSPGPHLHFHVMNGPNLFIDQGLPFKFSHFSAGGQFFDEPTAIPTRMIVVGPDRSHPSQSREDI